MNSPNLKHIKVVEDILINFIAHFFPYFRFGQILDIPGI